MKLIPRNWTVEDKPLNSTLIYDNSPPIIRHFGVNRLSIPFNSRVNSTINRLVNYYLKDTLFNGICCTVLIEKCMLCGSIISSSVCCNESVVEPAIKIHLMKEHMISISPIRLSKLYAEAVLLCMNGKYKVISKVYTKNGNDILETKICSISHITQEVQIIIMGEPSDAIRAVKRNRAYYSEEKWNKLLNDYHSRVITCMKCDKDFDTVSADIIKAHSATHTRVNMHAIKK